MERHELLLCFLLLASWSCAADARFVEGPGHLAMLPEIPRIVITKRCLDNSVTKVSCREAGDDRLIPHPDDCQLYYYCLREIAICRQCPDQLHFNPTLHVCDMPQDAGCILLDTTPAYSVTSASPTSATFPSSIAPETSPTAPTTGPTVPETSPTAPTTGPTVPETSPTAPTTSPTVPETSPTTTVTSP